MEGSLFSEFLDRAWCAQLEPGAGVAIICYIIQEDLVGKSETDAQRLCTRSFSVTSDHQESVQSSQNAWH